MGVIKSQEQQHSWNFPYQLLRVPPQLAARLDKLGRRLDSAADSELYTVPVHPGDLVLLFSDGFIDNLYDQEILEVLGRNVWPDADSTSALPAAAPDCLARDLALAAQTRSHDSEAEVPL